MLGVGAEETKRICGTIQTITGIALQKTTTQKQKLTYATLQLHQNLKSIETRVERNIKHLNTSQQFY